MLDNAIKKQLTEYFQKLEVPVVLRTFAGEHEKRSELLSMLNGMAELSDKLSVTEVPDDDASPISFDVLRDGDATGIRFSGIPGGHEFSSLILAILQAGGSPLKLDAGVQSFARKIGEPLRFQTVVSLSCHNCPDVVQALNGLSLLNDGISHEMIDGALFPQFVEEHNVQGVPAVFLNGKPFANGKIDAGQIIQKLIDLAPQQKDTADDGVGGEPELYDVAVVGGGPGGVASAVYSARKGLRVAVIADRLGGQVKDTMDIENLIALPKTTGPQLSGTLSELLQSYSVEVKEHLRVSRIENGKSEVSPKVITLNTNEKLLAKTVILATGAKWRELNVPGEKEYLGNGVAYCPHCDGPFFKGKDVAVIGGGNSGVEAALDLAGIVKSVKVLEFGSQMNADQILLDRLGRTANIESFVNAQTTEVLADGKKVTGLKYTDRESGEEREVVLDGVFVQIGLLPNTAFVKDLVETNRFGEIIVDDRCRTNVPGIFACGDATTVPYKQIVIAMGEGAKASLSAFEYLLKLPAETREAEAKEAVVA